MSTLIERLKEVMAVKGWDNPQQIANVAGVSRSAVAQWLGQGSKIIHTVGNMQAAENLERATGFRALWIAKGDGPKHVSDKNMSKNDWPLPSVDEGKVRLLNPQDLARLEAAILIAAAQVGLDIKKAI